LASRGKSAEFRLRPLAASVVLVLFLSACATSGVTPPAAMAPQEVSPETIATVERAVEDGRYEDARLLLERALLAQPDHPRALLAMAEIRLAYKDFESAGKSFGALTDRPDVAAPAQQGLGIALLLQGRDKEAERALGQAVTLDAALWRAWNALGSYYDRQGAWERATESYGRALALQPDSAILHNNRGFSNLLRRNFEEAIADFSAALRLDPNLVPARENLRLALAWTGQYQQALFGVPQVDIGRALNNVGFVALLRGDLVAAESYLLRSMEIDPKFNRVANKNLEYLKDLKAMKPADVKEQG
jgi:Tfp pilus assembly protein PilF